MSKIRWGIIGPGWAADQFAKGLSFTEDGILAGTASRSSFERAEQFSRVHGGSAFKSYESLLADPGVDIVYVSVITPEHKNVVLQCLEAGKPVVCEKPLAINGLEAAEMISLANRKGLFLMEAMWARFLPAVLQVRRWVEEGRIGEVQLVRSDHGVLFTDRSSRLFRKNTGGGVMLDMGVYAFAFTSMILGYKPERVTASAKIGDSGVDEQSAVILQYPDSKMAVLEFTLLAETPEEAWVIGTDGYITIKAPYMNGDSAVLVRESKLTDAPRLIEEKRFLNHGTGYQYQAEEAMRCLKKSLPESPLLPLDESLGIIRMIDRARKEIGLSYPSEEGH